MSEQYQDIVIRKADNKDFEKIWPLFKAVIKPMDTYVFSANISKEDAYKIWMSPENNVFVALMGEDIVGTYYIKQNQPGLGSHVANAAYMVNPQKQGYGIGKKMALHSIDEAKRAGYLAMQFNFVVSTNKKAIELWEKMGFKKIGTSPQAFKHPTLGFVDIYIMHRFLNEN